MLHRQNQVVHYDSSAAELIEETINQCGITLEDFARKIGVSKEYLADVLNHKIFIGKKEAKEIETATGISANKLLQLDVSYLCVHGGTALTK